jgi:hypothetical protein
MYLSKAGEKNCKKNSIKLKEIFIIEKLSRAEKQNEKKIVYVELKRKFTG